MNGTERELRFQTACLMIVAAVAIGLALYWLRLALVPFVLAIFFTAGLAPVLDLIESRFGAPRLVAVAIAFVLGVVLLFVLWLFIYLSVASLVSNRQVYIDRFHELIERTEAYLPFELTPIEEGAAAADGAIADNNPAGDGQPARLSVTERSGDQAVNKPNAFDGVNLGSYVQYFVQLLTAALVDISSNATIVLIFMFFLLLGGSSTAIPRAGVWREIEANIRSYIVTKTIISIGTGVAFGVALWLFGIPLALVFGLLAFLLNYIPNIGPVIAALLPLPLILLDPQLSLFSMIVVIVITSGIQIVSGNIVEPHIMGESFALHPVAVLLTLMFWGVIWGIVGMFLAVPMTAAVNILLMRFERTRPIAQILAGRFEAFSELLGDTVKEDGKADS